MSEPKDRADELAEKLYDKQGSCYLCADGEKYCIYCLKWLAETAAEIRAYGDWREQVLNATPDYVRGWNDSALENIKATKKAEAALASERKAREMAEAKADEADRMRGEALRETGLMQNQLDACIAGESRISDSEMVALLRRRAKLADKLEAEADKLRESLQKIASYPSGGVILPNTPSADRHTMLHIAREALEDAKAEAQERLLTANAWQEQARHLEAKLEHTETILAAAIQRAEQAEDRANGAEGELHKAKAEGFREGVEKAAEVAQEDLGHMEFGSGHHWENPSVCGVAAAIRELLG